MKFNLSAIDFFLSRTFALETSKFCSIINFESRNCFQDQNIGQGDDVTRKVALIWLPIGLYIEAYGLPLRQEMTSRNLFDAHFCPKKDLFYVIRRHREQFLFTPKSNINDVTNEFSGFRVRNIRQQQRCRQSSRALTQ